MPERHGYINHNKTTLDNQALDLIGIVYHWGFLMKLVVGPSIRNSIMMSNHAEGFKHITFNTTKPIKTLWKF